MKRLLIILLVLGLPLFLFAGFAPVPRVTYFGNEDYSGASGLSTYSQFNNDTNVPYICPGTGAQAVNSLEMYYKQGTGNIRCAIYTTARVLVMQGSAQVAVAGEVDAWVGHTAFVDVAGDPIASPQLTGGTHYLLVTTADGLVADVISGTTAVTSGYSKYISAEYTGGFPDPIAAGSNDTNLFSVRCGVTASGPATYYVDFTTGDDADTGLTEALAWKTIAKVNAASFAAGDSILFKRGETWREQLTVPSSGSAGNPITFGAYGTGADPVLDGANLVTPGTSWAAYSNAIPDAVFTITADGSDFSEFTSTVDTDGDMTLAAGAAMAGSSKGINLHVDDTTVLYGKKTFTAPVSGVYRLRFYLDVNSFAMDDGNYPGILDVRLSQAPWSYIYLQVNKTGAAYAIRGQTKNDAGTDDYINIPITDAPHYIEVWDTKGSGAADGVVKVYVDGVQGYTRTFDNNTNFSALAEFWLGLSQSIPASMSGDLFLDEIVATNTSAVIGPSFPPAPDVWTTAFTATPSQVWFDGVRGQHKTSIVACTSARDWYWAANVLYVYAASDPDTLYTAPGIEATARSNSIYVDGPSYVTLENFKLIRSSWTAVGIWTASSHITVQNNEITLSGESVSLTTDTGTDILISGNTIHDNYGKGIFTGAMACTAGHESIIRGNTFYGIPDDVIHLRSNYWIVESNTLHDNGSNLGGTWGPTGIHVYTDVAEGMGQHNIIRFNRIYNQIGNSEDGSGIGTDTLSDYNEIYSNIVSNCDGPGIDIFDSDHVSVYNNTCYGNMQDSLTSHNAANFAEFRFTGGVGDLLNNLLVKNNIGYATKDSTPAILVDAATSDNTLTITNNDWYRVSGNWYSWAGTPGATLATWNALTGIGTDLNADPQFVSTLTPDFHLQSASPCINAGTDVGLTTDYAGHLVPQGVGFDMGAYEYDSAARRMLMGVGKHLNNLFKF